MPAHREKGKAARTMKRALVILVSAFSFQLSAFGAFTEFYCDPVNGSNVNAGSTTSGSAAYTATNGGWNSGTGVFTPTSGNPSLTVSVGDFASVYTDGATVTGFIGRVTAVSSTTITVSTSAKSGTAPTTAGSGITCKVGGAWKGPNGAENFPWAWLTEALTNASSDVVRVNLKNNGLYSITASIVDSTSGARVFQGYSASPGDGGKAQIDGGTTGASYVLLNGNQANAVYRDLIFANNGATGIQTAINSQSSASLFIRCVVHDVRGTGFTVSRAIECEAYNCNQSNSGSVAAFSFSANGYAYRCIAHHNNAGNNGHGFRWLADFGTLINCISANNSGNGFLMDAGGSQAGTMVYLNCDAYNNSGSGFIRGGSGSRTFYIQNCNAVKNGNYGIDSAGFGASNAEIVNCGFGSGSQANTNGSINGFSTAIVTGSVTYASGVTPWVDPANGDFRINLAAAKGAGRGAFTQTQGGYSGTVGYPDIGAAQSQGGSGVSRARTQLP